MSTTTDEATILDNHPTEPAQSEHPVRPVHSTPPTRKRRPALRWFGGFISAIAAAGLVVALATPTDTDPSVNHVNVTVGGDEIEATELDVRGVPIWWSSQGGAPRHIEATELDVHGIPTWWSGRAPAP
jgi:hypothetical protein